MNRILCRIFSVVLALIFVGSLVISFTLGWQSISQTTISKARGEANIFIDVELLKQEKQTSESEEIKYIKDTVFYLFREDGEQIGGRYITDEQGKISVSLNKGKYYFEEITPSLGYTFDKNENGKITHYPFEVMGTEKEKIIVNAYNQKLEGSLLISKNIENADNSLLTTEQLDTEFEFTINFSDNGIYSYKIDNEEKSITSGQTLKLKHGQTAVFDEIPVGVLYNITEEKVNGYITTSSNHQGHITENKTNVVFKNIYDPEFQPSEEKVKLKVTKLLEGEYLKKEEQKKFYFSLIINGEETKFSLQKDQKKEFEVPKGATYEIKEDDYFEDGFAQRVENGFGTIYDSNIDVTITNTFVGEVKKEISGEKTWDLKGNTNISLPDYITVRIKNKDLLIEEKKVEKDQNGKWYYDFTVPKYDSEGREIDYKVEEEVVDSFIPTYTGYNIENSYIDPIEVEFPTIEKIVSGNDAPDSKFDFVLSTTSTSPMPSDSDDYIKVMSLYGVGTLNFGKITFTNPGIYTYTVYELNTGIKGWIYDDKNYVVTITITEKDGKLHSEVNWNGKENDSQMLSFTNTYDETVLGKNIIINGIIKWEHGNNPKNKRPQSVIVNVYGNNKLIMQKEITHKEQWKFSFELPKYDKNGKKITYTIDQNKIKNYRKSVNGYTIYNKFINTSAPGNPYTRDEVMKYFISAIVSGILLIILLIVIFKDKIIKLFRKIMKKHRKSVDNKRSK